MRNAWLGARSRDGVALSSTATSSRPSAEGREVAGGPSSSGKRRSPLDALIRSFPSWRGACAGASLLLLLTIAAFRLQLFDHWTFPWDFLGAYTTSPAFVAASVGSGRLLAWSPYVASGFPVAVDPQAGLYFPGWWLLGGLGVPATLRVLTAVQIAHVLFGSLGVLLLARARRLRWSWATLAAVAYLLFGGFYGEAEHADIVRGFAYLPWLLWALTPPPDARRWTRLVALPGVVWLIATGGYPAQVVSFGIAGAVYLVTALWSGDRATLRAHRLALTLALAASAGVCLAVLLPYLGAEHGNELHRVLEPTATVRAGASLAPRDLLGLYLSNFAWTYDGTITSMAIAIPMLIGLACVRWDTVRRHAPLVACGVVALALAMTPKIDFVGRAMVTLRPLFPSRFPAAEYKAVVALVIVVLAADGWARLASGRLSGPRTRSVALAGLMVLGALLVSTKYGPASREMWLVFAMIAAALALVFVRVRSRVLLVVLLALVVVDGFREVHDYRLLGRVSPWEVPSAEAAQFLGRDGAVRELPRRLARAPVERPARVPPAAPLPTSPTGSNADSAGWVASGYHLIDYGGTIERSLWRVEQNPTLLSLMLMPWRAYAFPCVSGDCRDVAGRLPGARRWHAAGGVRTISYGSDEITYAVHLDRQEVMVENELAIRGWHSNTPKAKLIATNTPLRAWSLAPGSYTFTASYSDPERSPQEAAAIATVLAWLACGFVLWRSRERRPT